MRTFKRYHATNYCYLVTTVTEGRRPYFESPTLARIFIRNLYFYRDRGDYVLHGFVVMPDHVHLLLTPLKETISDVMRNIKSYVAKDVREETGQGGAMWQDSFHDRVVRTEGEYVERLQYIHWNPVEAGMVTRPQDYEFSSARSWECGGAPGSGLGP